MESQKPPRPPPAYSEAVHGETSYGSAQAPSGVRGPMLREPDITYLKSVGGIVKIIEAVS